MIGGGAGILIAFVLPAQAAPPHRPLAPDELARQASVVGVASVLRTEVRRDPDNGGIFTDYHLLFHEVWKGPVPPGFVLTQYGGRIDDRAAAIPGWTYVLKPAEKFVLFAGPLSGMRHGVVGLRQGLFRISPQDASSVVKDTEIGLPERRRSVTSLAELKRAVYGATGREPAPAEPAPATAPGEAGGPSAPVGAPTSSSPDPRSAAAPADPGRSAGLLLALLLLTATVTIGWTQWKRKTETAG